MCSATRISHPLPAISFFPSSLYLGHKTAPSSEDPSVHQTLRSKPPALISISAISVHQRGIRSCDFSSSACHLWLLSNVHMHTQPSPPFLTSGPLLFSELQLLSLPLQISWHELSWAVSPPISSIAVLSCHPCRCCISSISCMLPASHCPRPAVLVVHSP